MTKVTRTYMIDDLDGETEEGVSTVQFNLDRVTWEIDLSPENADRLREKLQRFIDAAKSVKTPSPGSKRRTARGKAATAATSKQRSQEVRDWAKQAGLEVSVRGRISKATQEAYDAAH